MKKYELKASKEQFDAYVKCQMSGKWNMIVDSTSVMTAMKLNPRHKSDINLYFDIIKHYTEYKEKFAK